MAAVLASFAVVGVIIVLGYLVQRTGVLGEGAQLVLTKLVFFIASPALLFSTISSARPRDVFGAPMAVQVLSVVAVVAVYLVLNRVFWRAQAAETVVGAMSASYVNAGNLGIPMAAYVLGDASQIAPILLFQLAVYTPLVMLIFEFSTGREAQFWKSLGHVASNPILVASLAGVVVMLTGWTVPEFVMEPIHLLAGASVPCMLLTFGMSFAASGALVSGAARGPLLTSVALKNLVQPLIAYVLARLLFGLPAEMVLACVVMAALPTAQNVYTYALRFGRGAPLARDATLVTTLCAIPSLLLIAFLLTP